MKTYLKYRHTRNILEKNNLNRSVKKWFVNPRFEGSLCGNWDALLSVENYEEVKDKIPKSLKPLETSKALKNLF